MLWLPAILPRLAILTVLVTLLFLSIVVVIAVPAFGTMVAVLVEGLIYKGLSL
jgi:hypothetical protein